MTQWIAYSIGVALLLGAAAWAAEAALRSVGRPARGVWLAALAASALLPAYAAAGGPLPGLLPFPAPVPEPALLAVAAASPGTIAPVPPPLPSISWFPLVWAFASAALLGLLLLLELRLRRERRGWLESAVDGVPVLVSREVGPAVAGLFRGRIVLPAWALRLDEPVVRAIVAHEAEHVRAGDPRLLLAGLLAVCALPWNPVLWWQYRRLALAVELDCDARVLATLRDPRAYGLALLETARRRSRGALLHAALLRPRSSLQRRIEMMGRFSGRWMTIRALASAGVAALALVAAVCADSPAEPEADAPELAGALQLSGTPSGDLRLASAGDAPAPLQLGGELLIEGEEIAISSERLLALRAGRLQMVALPTVVIEEGEARYVPGPEPYWLVVSGRLQVRSARGDIISVSGDSVRLRPHRRLDR